MRPPEEMYAIHAMPAFDDAPVLVHAFTGYVDAGGAVRMTIDHILETCEHRLVATFDVDEVMDFRARRPVLSYSVDHFTGVDIPAIHLHEVIDAEGTPFLLLAGPEPDYQWLRFITAVAGLGEQFGIRLSVAISGIPWPAPHTRPLGITVHGSDPSLVQGFRSMVGDVDVPGHMGAMLEFHLAQEGFDSMGITAQVPHYLAQFQYPQGAQTLLNGLSMITGLALPSGGLEALAAQATQEINDQLVGNEEFSTVVTALEHQYDQARGASSEAPGEDPEHVPTGDEIAAQLESFLRELDADEGTAGA
ncbi:MAG: PAC2 family protein [Candidatus Nanopelagicales bacterium]|nr:PAC2 family protein [Candidatus Nanopelagicales bacterium]